MLRPQVRRPVLLSLLVGMAATGLLPVIPFVFPGPHAPFLSTSVAAAAQSSGGTTAADRVLAETNPDSALARTLEEIAGEPLRLEAAMAEARVGATALRDADAALEAARGNVRSERGVFDPELFAEAAASSEEIPSASPFSGADVLEQDGTMGSAGARMQLPIGTELEISLNSSRLETNSSFAALNPQYDAFGRLEITQPLLKGFGPSARGRLTAAERALEASRARRDDVALAVGAATEAAYWDLYAAERDLAVQQLIRDRAVAVLEEARLRAAAGLVGPNQVANARVFLAEQEQVLLDQEDRLDATSDRLATLIGRRPGEGVARFHAVDDPPRSFLAAPAETLVAASFASNLELRALEAEAEALRAQARGARWDALPQLDLFGSLGGNGLSGTPQDVIFGSDTLRTTVQGDRSDSWSQALKREYPTWTAGLRFTLPLFLREGRGERDRLEAEVRRAEERVEAARRALEERVRSAHRDLSRAEERLEFAREGTEAALDQVRIGLLEYRSGRTTAFELVRLGADLAAAQRRYSEALVRAARAAADLRRLTAGSYPGPVIDPEDPSR